MAQRKAFLLRGRPAAVGGRRASCAAELRSVNAQVEYLLRDALARRGALPGKAAVPRRETPGNRPRERPQGAAIRVATGRAAPLRRAAVPAAGQRCNTLLDEAPHRGDLLRDRPVAIG